MQSHHPNHYRARRPLRVGSEGRTCSGITIVEMMIALTVMTVCAYLLSATITATMTHDVAGREGAYASDVARNILEDLRAESFEDLYALYNGDPTDDPDGEGTAPGMNFEVPMLDVDVADIDGFVGRILFPGYGPELYEHVDYELLTLPRDLNGDGWIDGLDHSGDYIILPVCVELQWKGYAGSRTFKLSTVMADMEKY
ncbi:MAG: hypothetical protein ACI841_003523 [Planctomycetota bacterium]|jgi:hypothetical protein